MSKVLSNKLTYSPNTSTIKELDKILEKPNKFLSTIIKDSSIISTYIIGKEVYNIRDKASNKAIGYLGYLVSKDRLKSLIGFILNKALSANKLSFIILIYYPKEDSIYYLIYNKKIRKEGYIVDLKDFKREFNYFKRITIKRNR
jgi:hypothetical protein